MQLEEVSSSKIVADCLSEEASNPMVYLPPFGKGGYNTTPSKCSTSREALSHLE
jgi:hypothetical protein